MKAGPGPGESEEVPLALEDDWAMEQMQNIPLDWWVEQVPETLPDWAFAGLGVLASNGVVRSCSAEYGHSAHSSDRARCVTECIDPVMYVKAYTDPVTSVRVAVEEMDWAVAKNL